MAWKKHLLCAVLMAPGVCGLSACISLDDESGLVPEAVRSASANLSGNNYPNLAALPQVPKNLPTNAQWAAMERDLQAAGSRLALAPNAALPKPGETDMSWSAAAINALEADPRALPLPVESRMTDAEYQAWAAAERARLEAEIAALPPL